MPKSKIIYDIKDFSVPATSIRCDNCDTQGFSGNRLAPEQDFLNQGWVVIYHEEFNKNICLCQLCHTELNLLKEKKVS